MYQNHRRVLRSALTDRYPPLVFDHPQDRWILPDLESHVSVSLFHLDTLGPERLTSNFRAKFNLVEALPAYGTTIGSFHPRFEAVVM